MKGEERTGRTGGEGGPRIGVYVCHCGGNISDVVDVEKVARAASALPGVVVAREYVFMCSDPGQKLIEKDVREKNLEGVVVAACSPSLHEATFRGTLRRAGLNPFLYEHANIREQCSWCSKSDPAGATDKAARLVAAAVAKVRKARPLEPVRIPTQRRVVVIGGGVAGLRAARDLSRRGFKVVVLERSPFLGGRAAQLGKVYPTNEYARDSLRLLLDEILENPNITYYTLAEVTGFSGYVGDFRLKVRLNPRGVKRELAREEMEAVVRACPERASCRFEYDLTERKAVYVPYPGCYPPMPAIDWGGCTRCGKCVEALGGEGIDLEDRAREVGLEAGAVIMATGFDHYTPGRGEYGYGIFPQVITLPQLIRILDEAGPTGGRLQVNGTKVGRVSFIHCVGSRQVEGVNPPGPDGRVNEYCSRVCCTATLHAANQLLERFPGVKVQDFFQDIRTYGRGHEDIYEEACRRGVLFFRWNAEDPPVVEKSGGGPHPLVVKVKDLLTFGEEVALPTDLVVLSVGMVPSLVGCGLSEMLKLPRSSDGFLQEVHPKLRPVELAAKGLFIAGTCQGPMDITESCSSASAAASKATALLARGFIELDPFVAGVDLEKCTGGEGCRAACVEECRYLHAVKIDEVEFKGKRVKKAVVSPALCSGCGMCAAVCPYRAIQVEGWRLDQYEDMVDALLAEPEWG